MTNIETLFRREVSRMLNNQEQQQARVVSRAERLYADGRQHIVHLEEAADPEVGMYITKLDGHSSHFPATKGTTRRAAAASSSTPRANRKIEDNDDVEDLREYSPGRVTRSAALKQRTLDEVNEQLQNLDVVSVCSG
jgi:hypothetical protein